jgi:RNA polymerase-binding transcription factor DksA
MESRHSQDEYAWHRGVDLDADTKARQRLMRRRTRLLDMARSPERDRRIEQVDAALRWVDAGLYGRCSVCAGPLEAAQLEDDPADMTCLRCKRTARMASGRIATGVDDEVNERLGLHEHDGARPADFGLVSFADDDELRQMQFEAAARAASSLD